NQRTQARRKGFPDFPRLDVRFQPGALGNGTSGLRYLAGRLQKRQERLRQVMPLAAGGAGKPRLPFDRFVEQMMIIRARDLDRAEAREMLGLKLRVEQRETAMPQ